MGSPKATTRTPNGWAGSLCPPPSLPPCPVTGASCNCGACRRIKKLNPNEQYTVYEADVPDEAPIDEDEDILNYDDLDDPDAFV